MKEWGGPLWSRFRQCLNKYNNPKLDEFIAAQAKAYPNTEVRKKIFKEIPAPLQEEVPAIPLYQQWICQMAQPWIN
jgi:ABC-type transport system substrate-binding protein